ncbi:carbohydrate ABC transporter permease [Fundicoccus culcitae]|uniref:Sugar ABC transporter permease n=1 Tax=Fundicoccus culcitae TaxID=2969821 RepID=A0ABY5P3F0_9LACT|nr:sugar ABC transporter permease [Fundicoccus culcitae]UUX33184.1 sugar ABC transporter permease [Fundicoccus culcitae]
MEITNQRKKFNWKPVVFIVPAMIVLIVFNIYPLIRMVYNSFFNWNMISDMKFIGFENYERLFNSSDFYQILGNTVFYVIFTVAAGMILGLLLALYLSKDTPINRFLQSVSFMPYVVSMASISLLMSWMMNYDYGFINYFLSLFGIEPINWLGDPDVAMTSLVIISVWKNLGYNALILISALQSIPRHLYEAASLDNASRWRVFTKISLPMISPTIFFLTIISIINSFKMFETANIMTQGGPLNATTTLVYAIYEEGTLYFKVGYASAIGVVLLVILAVLTIIYFRLLSRRVHYQ